VCVCVCVCVCAGSECHIFCPDKGSFCLVVICVKCVSLCFFVFFNSM